MGEDKFDTLSAAFKAERRISRYKFSGLRLSSSPLSEEVRHLGLPLM